ncbi:MAG TPA: type 4a pilus biogenesis protein PilO [Candidatus Paceibacterota bacterium]|nr:type 4a pilus biogenesis protein PilO [Candidatus Paceibacterota bacterium]HRY76783.1 type 4a pilus biogenesis protein PilO [Candidatus Paceibacterota bacterium]
MKYTAKRNISLTLSLVVLILALVVIFVWTWPAFKEVGDLNKKINEEKSQYDTQYQAVQIAKSIIDQYKSLISVSQTISLSIPRGAEIQNLLAQLETITTQSGLSLQSINFENVGVSTPSSKKSAQNIVQSYKTLRLTLGLTGNYESLKTWLNAVESDIRLMDIVNIAFAGSTTDSQKNSGLFNFRVILNVYYQ